MSLSPQELGFVVEFIAACRHADDDAALEVLLADLRARLGTAALWTTSCGGEASSPGGVVPSSLTDCKPSRTAIPETTPEGMRSCQSDASGGSTCLFLDPPTEQGGRELLTHVVPHLLDAVARITARPAVQRPALTTREEQVLRWLAEGKSNWAIGQILGISERTVKYHLANVYQKLGVTTRTQAAALAMGRFV